MDKKTKLIISAILIILGVSCRLLPHMWNFAPVAAIALFAGVYLGRRYAVVLPVITMLIGDLFIGFYDFKVMLAVYSSFIIIGLLGSLIKRYKSLETVVATSLVASVLFYLVTNYAVWQFSPWYTKSFAGLIHCYTLALPFFRNSMLGDLFYTSVLFGVYEGAMIWAKSSKLKVLAAINN
ncbi:MAG: DUF6580 family putative transport protein [Patescibacteria group bacterium]|jgi:hypothetical protein